MDGTTLWSRYDFNERGSTRKGDAQGGLFSKQCVTSLRALSRGVCPCSVTVHADAEPLKIHATNPNLNMLKLPRTISHLICIQKILDLRIGQALLGHRNLHRNV